MSINRKPWIISKLNQDSFPEKEIIIRRHTETIKKVIESGQVSRDSILTQLTNKAREGGIFFDYHRKRDDLANLQAQAQTLSTDDWYYDHMFRRLCGPDKPTIDQSSFIASLKHRLSSFHPKDMELDMGLCVLFRLLKHFSVFPFDSSSIEEIDLHGFIRVTYFINEPRHHEQSWDFVTDLRMGPHNGMLNETAKYKRTLEKLVNY
jgi:hypothetical protein